MRLVNYSLDGDGAGRAGIDLGSAIADLAVTAEIAGIAAGSGGDLSSPRRAVGLPQDRLTALDDVAGSSRPLLEDRGALYATEKVRLGPPIPDPSKIVCLGLNYRDHAEESGLTPPSAPMFFAKFANSLVGPTDEIVPPAVTEKVDYEAEIAVVVGRRAKNVSADEALDYLAGAMAFNDISARDLQLANPLWTGGKAIDTFAPCGPAMVTLDELGDVQSLGLRTLVNGEVVQDGNTASMIFGVAETIAFLSRIMTLEPGDLIATGTPAGVGQSRTPPLFLQAGDEVTVEADGIGTLRNKVAPAAS
jgi:acylpyruvate hydrolase